MDIESLITLMYMVARNENNVATVTTYINFRRRLLQRVTTWKQTGVGTRGRQGAEEGTGEKLWHYLLAGDLRSRSRT